MMRTGGAFIVHIVLGVLPKGFQLPLIRPLPLMLSDHHTPFTQSGSCAATLPLQSY